MSSGAVQAFPVADGFLNASNFLYKPGIVGGLGIQIANGSQSFGTGIVGFRGSSVSPFGEVLTLSPLHLNPDPSIVGSASSYAMYYDTALAPADYVGGMITDDGTVAVTASTFIWALLSENRVYNIGSTPGFAAFTLFNVQAVIQNSGNFNLLQAIVLNNGIRHTRNTSGTSTVPSVITVSHTPNANPSISGATLTYTSQTGLSFAPRWNVVAGGTVNLGTLTAVLCSEPTVALFGSNLGTRNMTAYYGLDFPNFTFFTGTQIISVLRSALASGTNRRFLDHTGTARSRLSGDLHMTNGVSLALGTFGGSNVNLRRSAAGVMQMIGSGGANNEGLSWDFQTTANVVAVSSTTGANLRINNFLDINKPVALGGGAAATLGTIGGAGPTAAAQAQWVQIMVNGVNHWIAAWT